MPQDSPAVKGNDRTRRNAERRAERRAEMVTAAMDAVREHGPGVSVADIAKRAGITKPVLYRHFDDRADLQRAVGEKSAELLMARISTALDEAGSEADESALIAGIVDAFLAGIEDEPELWRFVVHNSVEREAGSEVVEDTQDRIARLLAVLIGERLRAAGQDSGGAEVWALGLVGMVRSAGDWWLERRTMSRADLTRYLTTLIWGGLGGALDAAPPASDLHLVREPDRKETDHA
ncbi:MAG: TetR/AcrR family transcriptional regulator [Pseudonocardia sp.]|nr:TetR/AcrR family transcriptional regulator [Pseudonocardia sp.]